MELVDYKEIAGTIRKTPGYVRDVIVKKSGFPKPIIPGRPSLWDMSEVMNYFIRNR